MASLKNLQQDLKAKTAQAATVAGSPVAQSSTYTDASPTDVATVIAAMSSGDLPWAVYGKGNLQFAVILPNGSVVNCYVNAAGTSAASRNAIHPAKREQREKRPTPDASALLKGL